MIKNDCQAKLGKSIRNLREELGLSQEAFSDLVGLHRTYIGSIERGERNLSLKNIIKIASALNVRPSELLKMAGL